MLHRNAPTSGRNPVLRLLFVGVALILRHVWVWLHAEVVAQPRRGGRRLHAASLRLNRMLLWLASTRISDEAQRS
jgi:putative transposase